MVDDSPQATRQQAQATREPERDPDEAERERRARRKVAKLRGFYVHALVYCVVNGLLMAIDLTGPSAGNWSIYPLLGWGLGLAMHGVAAYEIGPFGQAWEDRKVRELMDKDRRDEAGQAGPAAPTQEHGSKSEDDARRD